MKRLLLINLLLLTVACSRQAEDFSELDIDEIQRRVANGALSYRQLTEYYVHRIKTLDEGDNGLNAVITVNGAALEIATQRDRERNTQHQPGPLYGIPVLLKDNIDTTDGMPNTAGSLLLAENYPRKDAFLVSRLRQAGAVILGKSNLSEWANFRSTRSSSGWSAVGGQVRNPYDLSRSPCGSSSGSAVAVATGMATVAVGTETDGSVVCPAAINGIVGIKPTLGLVSRTGIIPIAHSQDTAGAMGRTVADAVFLLAAMVGADSSDKPVLDADLDLAAALKRDGLVGKRIGVVRNLAGYHDRLDRVFERALDELRDAGAELVDSCDLQTQGQWSDAEYQVLLYEFKRGLRDYFVTAAIPGIASLDDLVAGNRQLAQQEMPDFGQEIFLASQAKPGLDDPTYLNALYKSKVLAGLKGIDEALSRCRVALLVAPTTGPAWKIDAVNGDNYPGSASSPAAVAGYPHITVPMGYVRGLPVGLSFFGAHLTESTLIEAAYGYEQATRHRQPPALGQSLSTN